MMRVLFFILGVPMMIMSFFEAIDVLPFVESCNIIADGHTIELTQDEQKNLLESVNSLFENSHTMPAFGVVFDDMYKEIVKEGYFVSLKFPQIMEVNELPFDELVFEVNPEYQGFNLMRGMKGIFQGRCIYIDLQDKTMADLYEKITNLESVKNFDSIPEEENANNVDVTENINEQQQNSETDNVVLQENQNNDENDVEELNISVELSQGNQI